jgi:hypothetical protein
MDQVLKSIHVIAACVFVGSIPAHIALGVMADGIGDPAAFAVLHRAKYMLTVNLTLIALAAVMGVGVLMALQRQTLFARRWLQVKGALVLLIALNGMFVLMPVAEEMAKMAADAAGGGVLDPDFAGLKLREGIAGAVNLCAIAAVIFLGVAKPGLGQSAGYVAGG